MPIITINIENLCLLKYNYCMRNLKQIFLTSLIVLNLSFVFAESDSGIKAQYYKNFEKEHPFKYQENSFPSRNGVDEVSLSFVKEKQGYYIQNHKRSFQNSNRSWFILKLTVENNKVFISQTDVQNGKEIEKNKDELTKKGKNFESSKYRIIKDKDALFIYYIERTKDYVRWTDQYPFTYQTNLKGLFDNADVFKMTSDYLQMFAGEYVFDSYAMNTMGNHINHQFPDDRIIIEYDKEEKALKTLEPDHYNSRRLFYFSETDFATPFYWIYAEGAGYKKNIMTFADNGIFVIEKGTIHDMDDGTTDSYENCYYYKKSDYKNINKPDRTVTTNLRIRDKADLENSEVLVSIAQDSKVKIVEIGRPDYIDRITGNWVKVKITKGTLDKDKKPIQKEVTGWCFDGYLK